jgi:eukaryotic-like serine/threonine-protein kinase
VHEHVIPIHDVLTDGDTPYLVMQYVPGQSLQARVDERGPLEAKEVLRIARQAAAGLGAAHAQGVVHRDVKPANILLEESVERVLISDFGLARTVDDATLTRTGVVAGTPHYMSPEQATGQPVDHRSDLFSLGSSIYFMCTGRPPFRAEHALAILNRICNDQHRPVDEVNSDVPAELAEIVDRLLSKNPADRFRDAQEVERQLDAILVQLQSGQRSRRVRWRRTWLRWRNVIRKSAMAAGAIGVCVLIGFGLAFWNMPSPPTLTDDPIPPAAATEKPQRFPASIITVPPDTFQQDFAETQYLLDEISAHWNTTLEATDQSDSDTDKWNEQVSEILERISFSGEP